MIGPLIESLRPRQWTKNLLLFAGVLFSQQLGVPGHALRAASGFLAFSLFASAGYLVNDLRDLEADRRHPVKCRRPLASGRLPVALARVAVVPLFAGAVVLSLGLGFGFIVVAAAYLGLTLLYTFTLKHRVLLDVFAIAIGFVLRAIAGVVLLKPVAPRTELSPWLLVCTFFGALFLALAKRRRELANAGEQAASQRAVLDRYGPELLNGLLLVSAAASLMAYALYTIWPGTVAKFGTEALLYTIPFVAYGIFRYLYLMTTTEHGEDPSYLLVADRPLAICVALYLVTVLAILYRR
ncbi:MAG TPA: decaprenyl-phosphate phosphoribosyltransferase [Candidatus Eisenbacteria bacterium]|jgi:4-hydroxybenzoate polyprenyltransferase